jgi:hypothetical protein
VKHGSFQKQKSAAGAALEKKRKTGRRELLAYKARLTST